MAVLDRLVDVERLRWAQARRGLLTALAAFFYAVGWIMFWLVRAVKMGLTGLFFSLGFAASWSFAAMRVGWQAGRRGSA